MKKITKLLLLAGAGVAAWYVPTILAVLNLEVSIISVLPTNIRGSFIDAVVTVKIKNKSGVRVDLQQIKADILLNGLKIAQFTETAPMQILPYGETNFNVTFTIDAETVGQELWAQLIAQNLQNFVVDVPGVLTANNKTLPFQSTWTIKDIAV